MYSVHWLHELSVFWCVCFCGLFTNIIQTNIVSSIVPKCLQNQSQNKACNFGKRFTSACSIYTAYIKQETTTAQKNSNEINLCIKTNFDYIFENGKK